MERRKQILELDTRFCKDFEAGLANLTNEEQLIVTSFFKTVLPIFQERSEGYYVRFYSIYEKEILERLRSKARTIHNLKLTDYLVQDSLRLIYIQHNSQVVDDDHLLSDAEFDDFLSEVSRLIHLKHEILLLQGSNAPKERPAREEKRNADSASELKAEALGDHEEYMTIAECAKFLGRSKVTIHEYKKQGLPCYRIGRTVKFKKSEVLGFMRQWERKRRK